MGNFLKRLRMSNTVANKVLTTDENGNLKSSNKNVNDLATTDITNDLAERVTELEASVGDVNERLQDING